MLLQASGAEFAKHTADHGPDVAGLDGRHSSCVHDGVEPALTVGGLGTTSGGVAPPAYSPAIRAWSRNPGIAGSRTDDRKPVFAKALTLAHSVTNESG